VLAFIIGRRRIFVVIQIIIQITLLIYFVGVILSGVKTNSFLFVFSRFLTGLSVGGEFTAIFTAVDEFLPPKYRGRVNIGIDGTWHLGGALASILTTIVGETSNWRYMFLFGLFGIISLLFMRRSVPESPRWLLLKNRAN
jgi:MFS family permease